MENDKWNNVLIEWVNCLKLCKNIHNVDELRTGEFFKCLQKLLTKSNIASVDNLTFIFNLFQKHYPNYSFANKTEVHLADVPDNDLKAIVSLLMHYTCIFDRRDVLTSPMCQYLSPSTQLIIRNFLQKITKNITTEEMNLLINSCIEDVSKQLIDQWATVQGLSNNSNSSPLLDILKTPLSKIGRLQDKERFISKLGSDLEAERYEKSVLEGELKNQKEKNLKLETQLHFQKNNMHRLKEEILMLENKTPPHYKNKDSRHLERKLKEQILSLEECIGKLENEQIEMQKEKETAESQLKKVMAEAVTWKEQCFESDRQLEHITEHSEKYKEEIKALRIHCDELTQMLDGLKVRENGGDSSLSFNETLPCMEDLGAAVVEVQLREVKEENEDLRKTVKEITEKADTLKAKLEENEERLLQSELNRSNLSDKVTWLENLHKKEQEQLTVALLDLSFQKEHSESLKTQLNKLQETSEKLQLEVGEVTFENQELNSKIKGVTSEKDDLTDKLYKSEQILEKNYLEFKALELELESLKVSKYKLAQQIEESTICSSMLENKIVDLVQTCDQLKEMNAKYILDGEKVKTQLNDALSNCKNFEENIQSLEKSCESTKKQMNVLKQQLQDSHNERETIEKELDKNKEEMKRVNITKRQLENEFQDLNDKFNFATQQNKELVDENKLIQTQLAETFQKLEERENKIKNLQAAQAVLEMEQEKCKSTINILEQDIFHLLDEKEKVNKLLSHTENKLKEIEGTKSVLEDKNLALSDCVTNLQEQLGKSSSCLEIACKDITVLKEQKFELEINLKQVNAHSSMLQTQLETTLEDQKKIADELGETKALLNVFQEERKIIVTQIQGLEANYLNSVHLFEDKYNVLYEKIKMANEKLIALKIEFKNTLHSKMKLEELLNEANFLAQEKHAAIVLLDLQNESYLKQIEELKLVVISLENSLEKTKTDKINCHQKLIVAEETKNNLAKDKDDLLWKVTCLESDNKKLSENNEEVEQELRKMSTVIQDRIKIQLRLEEDLNQISLLKDKLKSDNENLNQQICEAKIDYSRLEEEMKDKSEMLGQILGEKEILEINTRELRVEFENIRDSYKNLLNENELGLVNAKKQNKVLDHKLTALERECMMLKEDKETLQNENERITLKSEEEFVKATTISGERFLQIQQLSIKVQNQNEALKQSQDIIDNLEKRCLQLNDFNTALQAELNVIKENHEKSELSKSLLQEEFESEHYKLAIALKRQEEFNQKYLELEESKNILLENFHQITTNLENNQVDKDALQQKLDDFELNNHQLSEKCKELEEEIVNKDHEERNYKSQYNNVKLELQNAQNDLEITKRSLERVNVEKLSIETQVLNYESKCQSLYETIQDYELTISGLKKIVDKDYNELSSLQAQISEINSIKSEITQFIDSEIDLNLNETNVKKLVYETIKNMAQSKISLKEQISTLEKELGVLKQQASTTTDINESMHEMIERIQKLLNGQSEINSSESLKLSFQDVYDKIHDTLTANTQLADELNKLKTEHFDIMKDFDIVRKEKAQLCENKVELEEKLKNLTRGSKPNKENVLVTSTKGNKTNEDDLKKQNDTLKKKIVLIEHSRNNLEKVVKELREEKKKKRPLSPTTDDSYYKKLLKEYIEVKEQHEKIVAEKEEKLQSLNKEISMLKSKKTEPDLNIEVQNIREAYSNVVGINSKLELEIVTLRKIIEERNSELGDLIHIKEAYEKIVEENNKALTDTDTMKYKRTRDKEEFIRLLKKEREEGTFREIKKVQEVRNEYEVKLEKMKEKMLKLYREEVNKKEKSRKDGNLETQNYTRTITHLQSKLYEAEKKIQFLELERKISPNLPFRMKQDEKASTLPRQSLAQEITMSRRTSIGEIPNLQMEDEEELFNNKYLIDLKAGNCTNDQASSVRFSELAMRNSMVPPHLKSSYPAEMQFISPGHFKDEDLKAGNIEFEDSLCKLLPPEKHRKKDFGTTSYKRPGPPTPSKNGGRLSLQGNEVHPMRDYGDAKTPKKSTPSRIRALFTGRTSISSSESQSNTTPNRGSKRLNIFRKPR